MNVRLKQFLLAIYDTVLPRDSQARFRLYHFLLWRIFPDPIDRKLHGYWRIRKRVKFIQIGACDGIYADNYRKFIRNPWWEGILIEPLPGVYARLVKNYTKVRKQGLIFLNCAISTCNGKQELYHFSGLDESHEDYKTLIALSSFLRDHLVRLSELAQGRTISSTAVNCLRFDDLVIQHNYQDVNILFIDTEGYDYEIIKSVDFDLISPDIIVYESRHLSDADKAECETLLRNMAYQILVYGDDTLAWKELFPKT